MKRTLLAFTLLFVITTLQAQTCTPDTSYNTPGIYPINGSSSGFEVTMPDAYVGVPYNELVQLKIPADTTIDTLGITIVAAVDSMRILNFDDLPASITYQCNNSNCGWEGGENGCAVFSGTPTQAEIGKYEVDIIVYGVVSAGILGSLADTLEFELEIEVKAAQGIDEFVSSKSIAFQPNPMIDQATLTFNAYKAKPYTVRVIDLTGRTVQEITGRAQEGANSVSIKRSQLPAGMYFYSLEIENASQVGRFIIGR